MENLGTNGMDIVIVQLASIVSQFLSQGIYGCVVWLKGYPVVNYEDIGVIQLYKMCLLLVNSYCTPLLLHIQPFYNTLFLCFLGYACTTVHHTLVPLSAFGSVLSCYNLLRPSSLKPFSDQVVDHHYPYKFSNVYNGTVTVRRPRMEQRISLKLSQATSPTIQMPPRYRKSP